MIVGYVPAWRQIWVIGDAAFTQTAQHLQFWKDKAVQEPNQALYIQKRYETIAFLPSNSSNPVKAILDALVNALHERPLPPHTLVILLDDNQFWCDSMLLDYNMNWIVDTMIKEIRRILEMRTRDLPLCCIPDFTTKVIISKLTFRPEDALNLVAGFKEKRRQFNNLLDKICDNKRIRTISLDEITPKFSKSIFTSFGSIARDGYRQIWLSLNNAIEDLDLLGGQRPKVFTTPAQSGDNTQQVEQYYTVQGKQHAEEQVRQPCQDLRSVIYYNVGHTITNNKSAQRGRGYKWFHKNNKHSFNKKHRGQNCNKDFF